MKTTIHYNMISFGRELLTAVLVIGVLAVATLPAACSGGGEVSTTQQADASCREEGCPCIFAHTCPSGMQCVNGECSLENPAADLMSASEIHSSDLISQDQSDLPLPATKPFDAW